MQLSDRMLEISLKRSPHIYHLWTRPARCPNRPHLLHLRSTTARASVFLKRRQATFTSNRSLNERDSLVERHMQIIANAHEVLRISDVDEMAAVDTIASSLLIIRTHLCHHHVFHPDNLLTLNSFIPYNFAPHIQLNTILVLQELIRAQPIGLLFSNGSMLSSLMQLLTSNSCHINVKAEALKLFDLSCQSSECARTLLYSRGLMASLCLLLAEARCPEKSFLVRSATAVVASLSYNMRSANRPYVRELQQAMELVLSTTNDFETAYSACFVLTQLIGDLNDNGSLRSEVINLTLSLMNKVLEIISCSRDNKFLVKLLALVEIMVSYGEDFRRILLQLGLLGRLECLLFSTSPSSPISTATSSDDQDDLNLLAVIFSNVKVLILATS